MTLQAALDQVRANGWDVLRGGVRTGLHAMPDGFVESLDELDELAAQQPPDTPKQYGKLAPLDRLAAQQAERDWRAERDARADVLLRQAGQRVGYDNARRCIEEHIAPALAERLAAFRADIKAIGGYASLDVPSNALMLEPDQKLREAWDRFSRFYEWYGQLRASFRELRRFDTPTVDPHGLASILSEVRNAPDVIGERWRQTRAYGANAPWSGPWPSNAPHSRAAWLLANRGELWLPSARQQDEAYLPHRTPPREGVLGILAAAKAGPGRALGPAA